MSSSVIGALRIVLGADTASLEKGLTAAQKKLAAFGAAARANMARAGTAVAAGVAAGVAIGAPALIALTKVSAAYGAAIDDMSQRVGIGAERLQELSYAASLAGVNQEDFGKALEQMNKRLGEVKVGTTAAQSSLAKLGLSLADIRGKKPDEAFALLAERISRVPDPMQQAALASEFFGRSGQKLLPVLSEGSAGLQRLAAEARRFGLVLSGDTITSAAQADDEFGRMGTAMKVAGVNLTVGLLPSITLLREIFTSQQFQAGIKDFGTNLGVAIKLMVDHKDAVTATAGALTGMMIGARLGGAGGAMAGALIGVGLASQAATTELKNLDAQIAQVEAEMEQWRKIAAGEIIPKVAIREPIAELQNLRNILDDLLVRRAQLASGAPTRLTVNKPPPGDPAAGAAAEAWSEFVKKQRLSIEQSELQARAIGWTTGALENQRLVTEGDNFAAARGIAMTQARTLELTNLGNAAQAALQKVAGGGLVMESLPAWDQYNLALRNAEANMTAFGASAEEKMRVQEALAKKFGFTWQQASESIAGSFQDVANSIGGSSSKIAKVAQVFGAGVAVLNTLTAQSYALAQPFPYNLAAMGLVAAKGAALVASIKSFSVPEMATGGALRMDAGFGGIDSQLLMARVGPQEQIDIWRPGEGPDPRRGAGGANITIQMPSRPTRYSREEVIDLIGEINRVLPDGYKIKVD